MYKYVQKQITIFQADLKLLNDHDLSSLTLHDLLIEVVSSGSEEVGGWLFYQIFGGSKFKFKSLYKEIPFYRALFGNNIWEYIL